MNAIGVRQSYLAAQPVFGLLNVSDRLGVSWADRPHGMVQGDWDALLAFADKHLLGKKVERTFDQFPPELQPNIKLIVVARRSKADPRDTVSL